MEIKLSPNRLKRAKNLISRKGFLTFVYVLICPISYGQIHKNRYFVYHKAQFSRFSYTINLGSAGAFTDLQKESSLLVGQVNGSNVHLSGGISYRLTNFLSLRASSGITTLQIQADERWENRVDYPIKTPIYDANFVLIHDFSSRKKIEAGTIKFNPYALAGVGAFYFNPYNMITGESLAETRKHNKDRVYPLLSRQYLLGGGITYAINNQFSMGWEFAYRYTETDYLDSTNPKEFKIRNKSNDHFITFGLSLTYVFKAQNFQGYNYSRHFKRRYTPRKR